MIVVRYAICGAVAGLSVLASCHRVLGPEEIAVNYLRAEFSGKRAEAYAYLSADDRNVRSLGDYRGDASLAEGMGGLIANQVSVVVDSVAKHGDSATVVAAITHPDLMAVMGDLLGAAFASALTGDTAKMRQALADAVRKKFAGKPLPTATTIDTLDLVREAQGWRVVRYWRAEALQARADSLRAQGRLREALALYDSALALAPKHAKVKDGREALLRAIAIEEANEGYIRERLILERFRVGAGSRFGFGDPQPAVFGTIRNRGDSTLTRVEITVYFLGSDGKAIGEKRFSPVLVSEFSFSDKGPLKPGYVRDFGYSVEDDAPAGWGRKARAEITRIEFQSERRGRLMANTEVPRDVEPPPAARSPGRVDAYDSLAASVRRGNRRSSAAARGSVGRWQVADTTNPLDDTRMVTLGLQAASGRSRFGQPVLLVLRCSSHKTEVYIDWHSYLGDEANVTSRVGSSESETKGWNASTDKTATFYPEEAAQFIQEQLIPASRFVAQVTPYDESPITAVFDLTGLETAAKPLREACEW
jgi:tetratricopeptide (TPR) repeat protein